jgi:hypothetical protein
MAGRILGDDEESIVLRPRVLEFEKEVLGL